MIIIVVVVVVVVVAIVIIVLVVKTRGRRRRTRPAGLLPLVDGGGAASLETAEAGHGWTLFWFSLFPLAPSWPPGEEEGDGGWGSGSRQGGRGIAGLVLFLDAFLLSSFPFFVRR
ncbi:hypothetical protein MLD38_032204 [Melastoma candidum]|uniref:Uncharacterized protein n=1 Tax=Melastoma candidum TaxID=119954 RepID=A0ACB9M2W0_9MYRT|nr:hypothetical protein MLD38_032204 [Melastoma candidum]